MAEISDRRAKVFIKSKWKQGRPQGCLYFLSMQFFQRNPLDALAITLSMPLDIDAKVLSENEASWHKSCQLEFITSKVNKAKEKLARKREQA